MTLAERVKAIAALGFTERQAGFLVTVLLHGGVCMDRHYCAFAGIAHGQKTTDFFAKLVDLKLAAAYVIGHRRARLFHLRNRILYDAIGEPDNRFRKPMGMSLAIERLMVLDAVLGCRGVSWLATEREKVAHFSILLRTRLAQNEFPHLRFGSGAAACVRFFPDKLPIGVVDQGREHVFGYLVRRSAPVDFRAFLHRHAELLRALGRWVIRLWIPGHFRDSRDAYESAWRQEYAAPLRLSTADELRWFFTQRRARSGAGEKTGRESHRYAEAARAFRSPRYRVLYRAWLRYGARALDAVSSPALADAISRGTGRLETELLPRRYLHLSSLVGTS
jgi:hypothetical protein